MVYFRKGRLSNRRTAVFPADFPTLHGQTIHAPTATYTTTRTSRPTQPAPLPPSMPSLDCRRRRPVPRSPPALPSINYPTTVPHQEDPCITVRHREIALDGCRPHSASRNLLSGFTAAGLDLSGGWGGGRVVARCCFIWMRTPWVGGRFVEGWTGVGR